MILKYERKTIPASVDEKYVDIKNHKIKKVHLIVFYLIIIIHDSYKWQSAMILKKNEQGIER